ncbi:hypothetical protein COCNU_scaffold000914G000020 [Cocos nucifera]|nr:hypothetical protein [Cocos nucifera]
MGESGAMGRAQERKDRRGHRGRRSAAALDVRKEEDQSQHMACERKEIGHSAWHVEGRGSTIGGWPDTPKFHLGAEKLEGHHEGGDRMVPTSSKEARGVPTGSEEFYWCHHRPCLGAQGRKSAEG